MVFVVVAAGSIIAFIIRDLGHTGLAGWIPRFEYALHSLTRLTLYKESAPHASNPMSSRRLSLRRRRSEVSGFYLTHCCFHWILRVRQS